MKKFLATLLASASLALVVDANPAKAALNYTIYEAFGNLYLTASGYVDVPLTFETPAEGCGTDYGVIYGPTAAFCSGQGMNRGYFIAGTSSFGGPSSVLFSADASTGWSTYVSGIGQTFSIDEVYYSPDPIDSEAVWYGKSLADIGLSNTPSGVLGSWTIMSSSDTITLNRINKPVPGPLPILGAGAAFGFSRRFRQRINASQTSAQR
jgi:hypothetical protein